MKYGECLKQKRIEKNINAKTMAERLSISPAYLSSLENGSRRAPSFALQEKIAEALSLTEDERYQFYDLAAENKQPPILSKDLTEFIYQNPQIIKMLRYAMKCHLTEKEWKDVAGFVYKTYKY